MFNSVIRKLFFLLLIVLFAFTVKAQKVHFIYLQTEGGQPFYAKFNNKLISSSSEGYIILPRVSDGVYDLVVGFPRNEFPEKDFAIAVDNKNEGYLLKNFGDKGWQLFNLQTLALIKGIDNKPNTVITKKDEDPFTKMLASVVKDSSILQNHDTISVATAKKADTSDKINVDTSKTIADKAQNDWKIHPPLSALDSTARKNELPSSVAVASQGSVMKKDSAIKQILNDSVKNGLIMIYEVKDDNSKTDTVSIFMPIQKNKADSINTKNAVSENKNISSGTDSSQLALNVPTPKPQNDSFATVPVSSPPIDTMAKNNTLANNNINGVPQSSAPSASVVDIDSTAKAKDSVIVNNAEIKKDTVADESLNKNEPTNETKDSSTRSTNDKTSQINVSDISQAKPKNTTQDGPPESQLIVLPKAVTTSKVNSDCKDFATTEDFLKLRKKMAAESGMDDMLKVAKKYFKLKCFSTEQVKDLSFLFLTDEGKYKFFDEAYAFTSDSDQYQILQSQFTDKYYLNRFKAMIGK